MDDKTGIRSGTGWGGEPVPNAFDRKGNRSDGTDAEVSGYRQVENTATFENASASRIRDAGKPTGEGRGWVG